MVAAAGSPDRTRGPEGPPSLLRCLDPVHVSRQLWARRALTRQLTRREIEGRYRGSFLGLLWSFISPLVLLGVYTFVGGVVLRIRWPGGASAGTLGEFALMLFAGLIAYNVLGECLSRAPTLVVAVPNYVKRVVFPLEVLPLSVLGSALFHAAVSLAVLLAFALAYGQPLYWTAALVPLVAVPLALLSLGLSWFLASLGVFFRDVGYAVPLALQVAFFGTPIMYPPESVPVRFSAVLRLNPLAWTVESIRGLVFRGTFPAWLELASWTAASIAILLLGYGWFTRTRKGFADVL